MSEQRLDMITANDRRGPRYGGFSATFFGIELKRLFKNYSVIIFTVVFPVAMLVLVAMPLKNSPATDVAIADGGISQAASIMVSMAVYAALVGSTMTGVSVAAERGQGWSRQLRLTPLNPAVYIFIKMATGAVLAALAVIVTLVAGAILGITAPLGNVIVAGVIAWLTSLSMTSLGLAVGYAFPAVNAMRYMGPLLPVLAFMGGLFVPLELLPDLLQLGAMFTPLWGIADLAQSAIAGVAASPWAPVNLVFWFLAFTGLAVMFFRRDTKRV